jgi:hypothetical protein
LIAAMTVVTAVPAFAELQNVEVGGSLRIRGNWYSQVDAISGFSSVNFDDNSPDAFYIEQRTTLNVKADFTDDVSAFIELDSYSNWGDDNFRRLDAADSGYEDFAETRIFPTSSAASGTPVNLYQGYIEMNDSWGYPISVRIGRSEMQHGSEFLVGNQDTSSGFVGLSFDGIWGTYTHDQFNIQAFWTRIAQNANGPARWEQSGDVDFMGVYGSYTGIEDMVIDAYYYYLNQAATDANGLSSKSGLHTLGLRFAGNKSQFDWELNGAYQLGDTGSPAPVNDFSAFGIQGALGYTFDIEYQPRIFAQGAFYSGADNGGADDPAFRRLFSDHEYSEFLDGGNLSNIWFVGGGASAQVTESIGLSAVANYYGVVEEVAGTDNGLGVELAIYATYAYSEDLTFSAGYAHFFTMDGIEAPGGQLIGNDGRSFVGGGNDGVDYVYLETSISF